MNKIIKCGGIFSLSCILGFCGTTNVDAYVITAPCSDTSAKVCQIEVETTTSRGSQDGYDEKNTGADNANQEIPVNIPTKENRHICIIKRIH